MLKSATKYIVILLLFALVFIPKTVNAKSVSQISMKYMSPVQACKCNGSTVLGDVNCECSTAWLLQKILNYIRIIGPVIAIILSSLDFAKTIVASEADSIKKAEKKLVIRLILALFLFLVPTIVAVILQLFGITGNDASGGLS